MDRPSTDAAAIAAATLAASLCEQLVGVTIAKTNAGGMQRAYVSAYRAIFADIMSREPDHS